jgi:hypothetical protein
MITTLSRRTTDTFDSTALADQEDLLGFLNWHSVAGGLNRLVLSHHFAAIRDPRTLDSFVLVRSRDTGKRIALCPANEVFELLESLS